jgi:hypothetical protein
MHFPLIPRRGPCRGAGRGPDLPRRFCGGPWAATARRRAGAGGVLQRARRAGGVLQRARLQRCGCDKAVLPTSRARLVKLGSVRCNAGERSLCTRRISAPPLPQGRGDRAAEGRGDGAAEGRGDGAAEGRGVAGFVEHRVHAALLEEAPDGPPHHRLADDEQQRAAGLLRRAHAAHRGLRRPSRRRYPR